MEPEKKANGALVGLIIIIIILIAGGIYMWQSNKQMQDEMTNSQAQSETASNQDSAELTALEVDVNSANTSTGVDANTVY
jgi:uncharacterized protein HemX